MPRIVLLSILFLFQTLAHAGVDRIDSLEERIRNHPQIQEKVYVHTDNSCYYLGDTLWYRAYVTRADNLKPTNISRVLYVELLTPDGYLVERQQLHIGRDGTAHGQFALRDTLYSGYYELRAYTRWQLNFNVSHKKYRSVNRYIFYSKEFERDYFRDYEGLYSRVLPIYETPDSAGDYTDRRIIPRPKQRIYVDKMKLKASFFPEGGQLVQGLPCRMAFEITDQDGAAVDITGWTKDGDSLRTEHLGRGTVTITPDGSRQKAYFEWAGKEYSFTFPKAVETGCTMLFEQAGGRLHCRARGVGIAAVAISCRGRVSNFIRTGRRKDRLTLNISKLELPTGVNDIVIYDSSATPIAARQIFINNNDIGHALRTRLAQADTDSEVTGRTDIEPYSRLAVSVSCGKGNAATPRSVSIAVRDTKNDEPTFDNGSMLTEMLLSGDLKGFVVNPAHYFDTANRDRQRQLDLLMMVQGWRKYKRVESIRYWPEKGLTYEGTVYRTPANMKSSGDITMSDLAQLNGTGMDISSATDRMVENAAAQRSATALTGGGTNGNNAATEEEKPEEMTPEEQIRSRSLERQNAKLRRKQLIVEAELAKDGQVAGITLYPDSKGHFNFQLPEYYGHAVLFVTAYQRKDSLKESLISRKNRNFANTHNYYPDMYVKRDWFFPNFVSPYSWYQTHTPELPDTYAEYDSVEPYDSVAGAMTLANITVRRFRKSKRILNYNMPAIRMDAYDMYNDVTDCGLSYGIFSLIFPLQAATFFFGYLGIPNDFKVRATAGGKTYYKNYTNEFIVEGAKGAEDSLEKLRCCNDLRRIKDFKLFCDYDKRANTRLQIGTGVSDVTTDITLIPDEGKRYVYSLRRYIYPGYNVTEEFYSPDYSNARPTTPTDYRRTLYWNPNATISAEGEFSTTVFTNSHKCRVSVNACGISPDGEIFTTE